MNDDLWRKLVSNAPEFIAIVDSDGVLSYANWFDNHPDKGQVVGSSVYDHTLEKHHHILRDGLTRVFEHGESASWQVESFDENGEMAWWATLVIPLHEDDLNQEVVSRAVLYGRKISDQKKIEAELQEQRDSLERKNTTLTEILNSYKRDIEAIQDAIRRDVATNLEPMFIRLRRRLRPAEQMYLREIEETLSSIIEPRVGRPRQLPSNLTPRETEICSWIKKGYTSREIAEVLDISSQTVDKFRQRIRRKLGLTDQRVNLTNYLRSAGETDSPE